MFRQLGLLLFLCCAGCLAVEVPPGLEKFKETMEGLIGCIIMSEDDIMADENIMASMHNYGCYCRLDQSTYDGAEPIDSIDRVCKAHHDCVTGFRQPGYACAGKTVEDMAVRAYAKGISSNDCTFDAADYCKTKHANDVCSRTVCEYCDSYKNTDLRANMKTVMKAYNDKIARGETAECTSSSSWYECLKAGETDVSTRCVVP